MQKMGKKKNEGRREGRQRVMAAIKTRTQVSFI